MAEPPQQMDEILASIRRIIAEEPPAAVAEGEEDVLELGPARPAHWPAAAAQPASPQPAPVPPPALPPLPIPPAAASEGLLSDPAVVASRTALAALSDIRIDPDAADRTMDGLVREMVRPMLKAWLDANLPEIVERLVAREIARLGGR